MKPLFTISNATFFFYIYLMHNKIAVSFCTIGLAYQRKKKEIEKKYCKRRIK